ncbi:MAG: SPOR domain-containing protein, partial [Myxococcota bacterium]
ASYEKGAASGASPAAVAAAKTEPAPKAPESTPKAAAPDDSAAEMTFYETSTGKAAMPGLTGSRGEPEDEEAPPDSEPDAPAEAPAVGEATVPDVAQREAAPALEPAPESLREPAPEPVEADAGPPSGAALLARRLAGTGARPVASGAVPASSTAAGGETYTVQVTTLADENEARRLAERLKSRGFDARVIPLSRSGLGTLYRIRVGRYPSEEAARRDLKRLSSEPGAHPYIRME